MKAPEKIYILKHTDYSDRRIINAFIEKENNNDIEYTRTDAFIKKVEDYLNSKLYDWVNIINPDQISCANIIPKKDFIEDFRNYMKGE